MALGSSPFTEKSSSSAKGIYIGEQRTSFDDWVDPYGWLATSAKREDFGRISPTNADYHVCGDSLPIDDEFNWGSVMTPGGWCLNGFRLTSARVTDTNQAYAYGGSSNVLAQIASGGRFSNSDQSLPEGLDEVAARMRSSVIDGAKALYVGDNPSNPRFYSHSTNTPLNMSTSFSVPADDRADTHYYVSLVFDYRDEWNFHELRFTRGDAQSDASSDNRLRLELVETRDGVERKAVHSKPYDNAAVNNGATHEFTASISMSGARLSVKLTGLSSLSADWSSIELDNCDPMATIGQVGFGAYDCAPKIDYIVISGGAGGTSYSAGSDMAYADASVSTRFSDGRSEWFLGGSDYTASASGMETKWYFDDGENRVLRRRVPKMKVNIRAGDDPFGLGFVDVIIVSNLQYRTFQMTFHA